MSGHKCCVLKPIVDTPRLHSIVGSQMKFGLIELKPRCWRVWQDGATLVTSNEPVHDFHWDTIQTECNLISLQCPSRVKYWEGALS